jgi:hypothetical protein
MKNRARLEKLKIELQKQHPEERVCTFFYHADDVNKDQLIKNHKKKCKKPMHLFLPHYKGELLLPRA